MSLTTEGGRLTASLHGVYISTSPLHQSSLSIFGFLLMSLFPMEREKGRESERENCFTASLHGVYISLPTSPYTPAKAQCLRISINVLISNEGREGEREREVVRAPGGPLAAL